uniref:Uncharacterized protein n=1 Tax=Grammatophora oceanica TaxID=210454 RepID=A0A7S1YFQ7_9STRA
MATARNRRNRNRLTPRRQGEYQSLPLSPAEKAEMVQGVTNFIETNNLHPNQDAQRPQITALLKPSRSGDARQIRGSINQYRRYWLELGRFATKLKDWRTAAICNDDLRPEKPLPADPKTILRWLQFKCTPHNTVVCEPHTGEPYRWPDGTEMKGGKYFWKAGVNLDRAKTAINMLHNPFELCRGDYFGACRECVRANPGHLDFTRPGRVWKCCVNHSRGGALLRPLGSPMTDPALKNEFNTLHNRLTNNHVVQGCVQLTPNQIRKLRSHLMTSGGSHKLFNHQTYVMILLGIKLFLRADELVTLKFENFRIDCFSVSRNPARINSLVVWVKGKGDTQAVSLRLYRDDDNPEFCPIRHLMLYIVAAKLKGEGFLFPAWHLLASYVNNNDGNGIFDQENDHVEYADLLGRIQSLINVVLRGEFPEKFIVGTHTLRKTAYFFAVFGILYKYEVTGRRITGSMADSRHIQPLEDDALGKAARHKAIKNATLYFGAVLTRWEDLGFKTTEPSGGEQWQHNKVSEWKGVFYGVGPVRGNEDVATQTTMPLVSLASWYVTTELDISIETEFGPAIVHACFKPPNRAASERLVQLFESSSSWSAADRSMAMQLHQELVDQARRDGRRDAMRDVQAAQQQIGHGGAGSTAITGPAAATTTTIMEPTATAAAAVHITRSRNCSHGFGRPNVGRRESDRTAASDDGTC